MMLPPAIPITGGVLGPPGFSGAGSLGSLGSDIGVGPGPGPQRHPKPLTAADLHSQLEREQEAVVGSARVFHRYFHLSLFSCHLFNMCLFYR